MPFNIAKDLVVAVHDAIKHCLRFILISEDWLFAPPEVAAQFVGTVAFQFVEEPPPFQNRLAIRLCLDAEGH